jgi:hypothetical protein
MTWPTTVNAAVAERDSAPPYARSTASSCTPEGSEPGTVATMRPSFHTETGAVAPPTSTRVAAPA